MELSSIVASFSGCILDYDPHLRHQSSAVDGVGITAHSMAIQARSKTQ